MAKILSTKEIAPKFKQYEILAPEISKKHKAGQFIILMLHEKGERIPLTIADTNKEKGTITLVVQEVGKTTAEMATLKTGDELFQIMGPLGTPTHIKKIGTCLCIGGGAGIAPLHPIAKVMKEAGNKVVSILGGRTKDLVILRDEMEKASNEVIYTTDDGSFGKKGFVTTALEDFVKQFGKPDEVIAIGPAIMMKVVSDLTRKLEIPTVVSLNSIMIDGTGMCGGCRVAVGNESKFVCVDGPEFDGHKVDFDLLMNRLRAYTEQEKVAMKQYEDHKCKIGRGEK